MLVLDSLSLDIFKSRPGASLDIILQPKSTIIPGLKARLTRCEIVSG